MITGRPGHRVICINDGRVYDSITKAAENYNLSRSTISRQLAGERTSAGGRYFMYVDDDITSSQLQEIRKQMLGKIYNIENIFE